MNKPPLIDVARSVPRSGQCVGSEGFLAQLYFFKTLRPVVMSGCVSTFVKRMLT